MAYDVSKRPGEFARSQALRHQRAVLLATVVVLLTGVVAIVYRDAWLLSIPLLLLGLAISRLAERHMSAFERWNKGRVGEESVGKVLDGLIPEGFTVLHDIEPDGYGNVDHLVSGPSGVFVIDSKYRSFPDDALRKVMRKKSSLQDELGVPIIPIICKATVDYEPRKRAGVCIVGRNQLAGWIRSQRNATLPFERLARFADRL